MKALISGERVVQLSEQEFPVAAPLHWVDAPEDVTTRHRYVDGEFVLPQPSKEEARDTKLEEIRSRVQQALRKGAPWDGERWPVDAEAQFDTVAVRLSIADNEGLPRGRQTIPVDTVDGTERDLDQQGYRALSSERRDYVFDVRMAARDHRKAVLALYADPEKSAEDISAYDASGGWLD